MLAGDLPRAVDVPTGLGKTAVMAIWLVARAAGANVPRRLVYVVDRRAVVDQATEVAERLRTFVEDEAKQYSDLKRSLGLSNGRKLPISTLRGQYIDNQEWLVDPSSAAIVVGTVDMIGSRLLFQGYGVSRRMRSYHAGLLGADALLVLDEAHLISPFEHLVEAIANRSRTDLGPDERNRDLVPSLRLLSLSATGKHTGDSVQSLGPDDYEDAVVRRRLAARKELVLREEADARELATVLAREAWQLAEEGTKAIRCVVFCNSRDVAQKVRDTLREYERKAKEHVTIELFVGARRAYERQLAADWLKQYGFLAGSNATPQRPTFLVATSAAEVGVDLDADHMVCDLVPFERMVQRLGRVNRRGDGASNVIVVPQAFSDKPKDSEAEDAARIEAVRDLLKRLPPLGEGFDVSPRALKELKDDARNADAIRHASSPDPLYPPLCRAHVESWSMSSLAAHPSLPGVTPWLRGWVDEEPQTSIVWRRLLPVTRDGHLLGNAELEAFFEAAGPHVAEQLETETWRAFEWLSKRFSEVTTADGNRGGQLSVSPSHTDNASEPLDDDGRLSPSASNDSAVIENSGGFAPDDILALILGDREGDLPQRITARDVLDKKKRASLERALAGATLIVDTRLGGLDQSGLLDSGSKEHAVDVTTLDADERIVPFRVGTTATAVQLGEVTADWRQELCVPVAWGESDDATEWLLVESRADKRAQSEEGRSAAAKRNQKLDEHEEWAEEEASKIAARVLPDSYRGLLTLAARLHDEGKRALRWQRAFRAPSDGDYAKTTSRPSLSILGGYRHELGSLPRAERDARMRALADPLRDLCLHVIAAHHGGAHPILRIDGAEEPPTKLTDRAREIALRFTRLQRQWGPWGLAWWETLLRAADQQASRRNDEVGN
jgi:CRISPR-associated endonuclease/helicase Cas3